MRYVEFRKAIAGELRKQADGLTWSQLREHLNLPYERPCPTWIKQLEEDIGLLRERGAGRALIWKMP